MNADGAGILPRRCREGDAGHRQFLRKDVSAETVVAEKQELEAISIFRKKQQDGGQASRLKGMGLSLALVVLAVLLKGVHFG